MEEAKKEFQQIEIDFLTPTLSNNETISTEEINYNKRINEINIYIYLLIIFPMLSYSLLGFVDDMLILKKKSNK